MSRVERLFAAILLYVMFVGSAAADYDCPLDDAARESEWISKGLPYLRESWTPEESDKHTPVHWDGDLIDLRDGYWDGKTRNSRIHPVTRELPLAVQMLARRSVAPLNQGQVVWFSGIAAADMLKLKKSRLKPYLIRAVFPSPNPEDLGVRWRGETLYVRASSYSCTPFTNHPIIVFLQRRPKAVKVKAYYLFAG